MTPSRPAENPQMPRLAALLRLAAWAIVAAVLVAISVSPRAQGFAKAPSRGPGDVALYRAEIDRLAAGQAYYQAAADELRRRGYPTRSVFNWRTPLPVALIGALPDPRLGQAILGLVGLAVLLLGFDLLAREGGVRQALAGAVLLTGALLPCLLGDLYVMPELWSGIWLALSLVAYGTGRRRLGLAAGLAALFFRELAAPYCLIAFAFSLAERRGREAGLWIAGFGLYAAYYAAHLAQVWPLIRPTDLAHADGWLRLGGAAFVLALMQMNAYLLVLPQWVTALYLALALLGFASWNTAAGRRAAWTAVAYLVAFGLVGNDFNQYWGSLLAPWFCLGAARGLAQALSLLRSGLRLSASRLRAGA